MRIVRLALRYGVQFEDFKNMIEELYIRAAREELSRLGLSQAEATRIQALTGIYRKRVVSIQQHELENYSSPTNDLISEWTSNPRYMQNDKAALLPIRTVGSPCFTELVKKHFNDLHHRSVLDQMVASGNLRVIDDGWVELVDYVFGPKVAGREGLVDLQSLMESAVHGASNLLLTASTNIDRVEQGQRPLLQQKQVWGDHVPRQKRLISRTKLNELVVRANEEAIAILKPNDGPANPFDTTYRVGVGFYVFELPVPPSEDQ